MWFGLPLFSAISTKGLPTILVQRYCATIHPVHPHSTWCKLGLSFVNETSLIFSEKLWLLANIPWFCKMALGRKETNKSRTLGKLYCALLNTKQDTPWCQPGLLFFDTDNGKLSLLAYIPLLCKRAVGKIKTNNQQLDK